jgi:hypothetical protein
MRRISGSTFYFKKFFPALWFGGLAFFAYTGLASVGMGEGLLFLGFPILMAVLGYFIFRTFVWDLADEVFDAGDELIFRKGNKEQRVKLKDIVNVGYSQIGSPERIVISAGYEGPIGKELVFNPPLRLFGFTKNPIVTDLIERVDRARNA